MSGDPSIIPFEVFERGAFASVAEPAAGGYRWAEQAYVTYFGRTFLHHASLLDIENFGRINQEPHSHPITDFSGFRRSPVAITGPWLTTIPLGPGEWDGDLVRARPALTPSRNEPELHRRFAQLTTRQSILRFANRYGLLGGGLHMHCAHDERTGTHPGTRFHGLAPC